MGNVQKSRNSNLEKKAENLEKKAEAGVVAAVDSDGR